MASRCVSHTKCILIICFLLGAVVSADDQVREHPSRLPTRRSPSPSIQYSKIKQFWTITTEMCGNNRSIQREFPLEAALNIKI